LVAELLQHSVPQQSVQSLGWHLRPELQRSKSQLVLALMKAQPLQTQLQRQLAQELLMQQSFALELALRPALLGSHSGALLV
jgi:hypothetical protein